VKRVLASLVATLGAASLLVVGCAQGAPAPSTTTAPPPPTQAAQPTQVAKAATTQPTAAPAAQPTAVPAKAVDWPQKGRTVSVIVPFAAGGAADIAARATAAWLEKDLGVPFQIINKAGSGAQLGNTEIATAKPDGYTLGWCPPGNLIPTYMDASRKAIYTRTSFQPIATVARSPFNLVVKADSSFKTVKDLVDAAKAKPGQVSFGDTGPMSGPNIVVVFLQSVLGVTFAQVHFDGSAPTITALLGGHIDASMSQTPETVSQVKSGQLQVLAVMDDRGTKYYPDTKTIAALGYPLPNAGIASQYQTMFAPAGTPMEIVNILTNSIKKSMDDSEMKAKMDALYFEPSYMDPAETAAFWAKMETDLAKVFKELSSAQ
jgi:tripartite-type tricarboxylate transporter receptor subunit TctC